MVEAINILFVGGSKRYSAAQAFLEAGKSIGVTINIFAYEMGYGLPIATIAEVIQGMKFTDPNVLQDLAQQIEKHNIHIAIPYHDRAVGLLSSLGDKVFVPTCSDELCQLFFSKKASSSYFTSIGLPVATFKGKVPAIAKPDQGSASKGLKFFYEQGELESFLENPESENYEVQRFIEGTEYSVDGYIAMNSDFNFFAVRKRLEVLGGEAVKSITVDHEKIQDACQCLKNQPGIGGAITIQFIEDSTTGEIYTMEVNPRFGGAMLTTYGAGVPWFEILLKDYLKLQLPEFQFQPNTLMVRSFREHFFNNFEHE